MASTHKSLRSGTANKRPTTSIADGQIALNTNTTSPGLFFKDSTGATIIKVGPVHVGTTAPNASPAAGGSSGNSTGEVWLDTSLTPNGVKIWNGASWTNATPIGSTTVQGLLELATNAETQTGTDPDRAVTPAGLQSKVSDSTSTTSSTTIASSTAVKSAYDLANAALPKSGGTVTGNLEIGTTGSLSFEGATADAFETTIAVVDPTADRTITLPDTTGTVVTTGDTGTVTSTMIADGTIVNGDINASAAVDHSKLANITAGSVLLGNASNVPTATALSGDVTVNSTGVTAISSGVIVNADVNASAAIAGTKISPDFGSQTVQTTGIVSHALGTAGAPTVTFTGDTNTGIYSPGADQVAISTGGSGRLFVDANGNVGVGVSPSNYAGYNNLVQNGSSGSTFEQRIAGALVGSLTTAGDVSLRSVTAIPLTLYTNNTERLRITSAGLVGVGTSSPSSLLEVFSSTSDAILTLTGNVASGSNVAAVDFKRVTGTVNASIRSESFASNDAGALYLSTRPAGGSLTQRLYIAPGGNVGIGTSSPGDKLEVNGNGLFYGNTGSQNGIFVGATSSYNWSIQRENVSTGDLYFGNVSGGSRTTRMTLTDSGRLGIGSTPSYKLDVDGTIRSGSSGSPGSIILTTSGATEAGWMSVGPFNWHGGSDFAIGAGTSKALLLGSNNAERARIDSSGRLLVGTSSESAYSRAIFAGRSDGNAAGLVKLQSTNSAPASGDTLGNLLYGVTGATTTQSVAEIYAARDGGTWTNNSSMPGRLVFSTTRDAASSPTEAFRITNTGAFKFTNTGSYNSSTSTANEISFGTTNQDALQIFHSGASPYSLNLYNTQTTNNGTNYFLYCSEGGTQRASIRTNGGLHNYQANNSNLCDEREKKNIESLESTWDCLKHWELKKFHYNEDADTEAKKYGVIAQQVEEHCPEVITEWVKQKAEPAKLDDEGNELEPAKEEIVRMGVKEQQMYWMAIKALQEAQVRIEALEAEVTALKAQ